MGDWLRWENSSHLEGVAVMAIPCDGSQISFNGAQGDRLKSGARTDCPTKLVDGRGWNNLFRLTVQDGHPVPPRFRSKSIGGGTFALIQLCKPRLIRRARMRSGRTGCAICATSHVGWGARRSGQTCANCASFVARGNKTVGDINGFNPAAGHPTRDAWPGTTRRSPAATAQAFQPGRQ